MKNNLSYIHNKIKIAVHYPKKDFSDFEFLYEAKLRAIKQKLYKE